VIHSHFRFQITKNILLCTVTKITVISVDDEMHVGHGRLSMADGGYYEGEFDRGEINGHGLRYFAATRNHYCGEFCAGELHGQGVMSYADGSTYEGTWADNKREGLHFLCQVCRTDK